MVMKELQSFRTKINSQKFELKKNRQIKNLEAEKEYFKEEALHFHKVGEDQKKHIKEVHGENEGLRDDAYVLRQALFNTKVKQRAVEEQLEQTKNDNLELMV